MVRTGAVALAAGLLAGSLGSAAPATAEGPLPVPPGATADGPALRLAELDPAIAAAYSGAALVDVGGGCSGVLVAPVAGPVPPGAPATVLTNGHCIDFLPPTAVMRHEPGSGSVTFGWPGSGRIDAVVGVAAIPWASMKGTDLAVLTLDAPLADLLAQGVRPLPIAGAPPPDGSRVVIVGAPSHAGTDDRELELVVCTLGPRHALVEGDWSWTGFASDHCGGIRPGSSGSPVIDPATGELVGLINTGTAGSDQLSDCAVDRPCEVGPAGGRTAPDTSYGPLVAGLGGCFDAGWRFTGPGPGCPLDPGTGVSVEGATRDTNPDVEPISGRPAPTTWGARLVPSDPSVDHVRAKTGALGKLDCHDLAGYGPPVAIADQPFVDAPLPDAEGHYQLCLLGGPGTIPDVRWQEPRFATAVTVWVDRTPPKPPVELRVVTRPDGWEIEPVPVPTELVAFRWKWGPATTTDCADPAGYAVWRHAARTLQRSGAPWRVCVVGYDEASNPSPTLERTLQ
jgi:hypothetical protein